MSAATMDAEIAVFAPLVDPLLLGIARDRDAAVWYAIGTLHGPLMGVFL